MNEFNPTTSAGPASELAAQNAKLRAALEKLMQAVVQDSTTLEFEALREAKLVLEEKP